MNRNSQTDPYSDDVLDSVFFIFEFIGAICGLIVSCLSAAPNEPFFIQFLYAIYFMICGMIIAGVILIVIIVIGIIISGIINLFR